MDTSGLRIFYHFSKLFSLSLSINKFLEIRASNDYYMKQIEKLLKGKKEKEGEAWEDVKNSQHSSSCDISRIEHTEATIIRSKWRETAPNRCIN